MAPTPPVMTQKIRGALLAIALLLSLEPDPQNMVTAKVAAEVAVLIREKEEEERREDDSE